MAVFQFPMLFPSGGVPLAGRVYRNVDNLVDPQPSIMVTGSWLTVKEQMSHTYALALAERGYTAFTFDFAGFGQSAGVPRQLELPARKIADIIAAADFLSTMSFVRGGAPGHLGICASAQYALAAIARGARIRSFASVAGWYHDAQSVAAFYGGSEGTAQRLEHALSAHGQTIEDAIRYADPMVLRGLLYQLTGDAELLDIELKRVMAGFFQVSIPAREQDVAVERENLSAWEGQQNRRMRRDEKLGLPGCREVVDDLQEGELSLRRQRRLRFVQDVDSMLEAVGKQGDEGFPVRLLVQRLTAVRAQVRHFLDVGREVVEALSAQEEPFSDLW